MKKTEFRKTTMRLSKTLVLKARRKGLDEGKPMRLVVEEALFQYLGTKGKQKGGRS
ncbi:MAG: hypothetical protein JXR49_20090 [Acidobacteria bacterium]|nr:hypothetical protein [Acidobacteriota bacterium]